MKKIRIGKTITCTMTVTTDGLATSLEEENLSVDFVCEGRLHHWASGISVSGNVITAVFEGSAQRLPRPGSNGGLGRYIVTVYKNYGEASQTAVDFLNAFALVPLTSDEEDDDDGDVTTETVDLGDGDFAFAGHTLSIVDGYWYVDGVSTGYPCWGELTCDSAGNLYANGEVISTAIPDALATIQSSVNTAVSDAEEATAEVTQATDAANEATDAANEATDAANDAAEKALAAAAETMGNYYPTALEVEYPAKITLGNTTQLFVVGTLAPSTALGNIVFQSYGDSIRVRPDGEIKVLATGTTEVDVIPTMNTALYKTIYISVVESSQITTEDDEVLITEDEYILTT